MAISHTTLAAMVSVLPAPAPAMTTSGPGQVLGLTFTRKAAGQLLRRVRSRLARLAGGLAGERQPQHLAGVGVAVGDQPHPPRGHGLGLAGTGPRDDDQRPRRRGWCG
ncbi:hypothetical protein MAHJHV47_45120 [Mycobacterium avium subsp. hominissuis]